MSAQSNSMATADWIKATQDMTITSYVQPATVQLPNAPITSNPEAGAGASGSQTVQFVPSGIYSMPGWPL